MLVRVVMNSSWRCALTASYVNCPRSDMAEINRSLWLFVKFVLDDEKQGNKVV